MKQYALNMLMAVDQFLSTVLGGHPDDTVSQRLGRAQAIGGNRITRTAAGTVDALAYYVAGEKNHCANSLTGRTSAKELWNWGGDRSQVKVTE